MTQPMRVAIDDIGYVAYPSHVSGGQDRSPIRTN